MDFLLFYIIIGVIFLGFGWTIFAVFFRSNAADQNESSTNHSSDKANSKVTAEKKGLKTKAKNARTQKVSESDQSSNHPWLLSVLKGHSEDITGLHWSSNGKYLVSCANDRTVLIWLAKDKDLVAKNHKNIRVNIPFDSAGQVFWSPDCKAFVVSRLEEKFLEVFKLGKKPDGTVGNIASAVQFQKRHKEDVVGMGIACHGKFMVSGSSDGKMFIWNLKGTILDEIQCANKLNRLKISNCGRYISLCGSNQEVIVYEVLFADDRYKETKIKWKLVGHESVVSDFDFNTDSSQIVTVTEKGNWRLFDTTGSRVNISFEGSIGDESQRQSHQTPTVALSPDCRLIAVGFGNDIHVFVGKLGNNGPISSSWEIPCDAVNALMFSSDGKFLVAGSGRNIRVFHNVAGFNATIADLKRQMQDSTVSQALKTRLSAELKAAEQGIKSLNLKIE